MGKRMITYLLVLGAVGYLFLMYIYPALSGLLIFVLLYPAAGIVYLIFAGRGLSVRVKPVSYTHLDVYKRQDMICTARCSMKR